MNRAQMALYLDAQYPALIAVAFPAATYTADTTFSAVIDAALRAQGVAEAALPTYVTDDTNPTQNSDTLALCDYFALQLILRQLAVMADVQSAIPQVQKKQSQMFAQTKTLLDAALAEITQRGYGPNQFEWGRLQLDIFEPQQVQGYTQNPWTW